jgi:voltage-gated potassium channel
MKTNSASSAPHSPLAWIGLAGVAPDENPRAQALQQRLHWWMVAFALLSLPAYFIDSIEPTGEWHRFAMLIDGFILLAFLAEAVWMSTVTSFPLRYLAENWLNLVVMIGAAAALFGATTEWVALIRVARVAIGGMMLVRAVAQFRYLFSRRGAPALVGVTFLTLLAAGGMFYWLDPRITNFWDGLWLAFVSGTTVGYGDVVPTSSAGRLVAAVLMLAGVSAIPITTSLVVSVFVSRLQREQHAQDAEERKELVARLERIEALLTRESA